MKAYIIRHPRQKDIIIKCTNKKCDGCCDEQIFSKKECAENMLEGGYMNKHYRVEEVEIKLT